MTIEDKSKILKDCLNGSVRGEEVETVIAEPYQPSATSRVFERFRRWRRARMERRLHRLLDRIEGGSNLVDHIRREMPESDDEMQNSMREHLIRMGKLFAAEGHSGFSASYAIAALQKLLNFEPMGPLTGEPDEWLWLDYDDEMKAQNKRCGHVFMRADGTAYDSEGRIFRDSDGFCFTSRGSAVDITFPYIPNREYVDVPADRD